MASDVMRVREASLGARNEKKLCSTNRHATEIPAHVYALNPLESFIPGQMCGSA